MRGRSRSRQLPVGRCGRLELGEPAAVDMALPASELTQPSCFGKVVLALPLILMTLLSLHSWTVWTCFDGHGTIQ